MQRTNSPRKSSNYHSPVLARQRAYLAFDREPGSPPGEALSQDALSAEVLRVAIAHLSPGIELPNEFQLTAVPRIYQAEGKCNWQVVVFLPVASEVLTAIRLASAIVQGSYDMQDEFQGARALLV